MKIAKVVVVRANNVFSPDGNLSRSKIEAMLVEGFRQLSGSRNMPEVVSRFFLPSDRVGIKINTIAGRKLATRPELPLVLTALLAQAGLQEKNILIWDRTNRELREAGYSFSTSSNGPMIYATDTSGIGYEEELISHRSIAGLFSTIQTRRINASISLAILKDHGLAGVTAGMKNYFGAIHNPNKYHDHRCDPFVADLFDAEEIRRKHRLSIIDALLVQYHRGPSYHPQWAAQCNALIFSRDPVAADSVAWRMIEDLRFKNGLPSLGEESREPVYLATAEKLGLGWATAEKIQVVEVGI